MKCRLCDADSRVLETRAGDYDTVKRRRECANGHRFTTIEMHSDVSSQAPHAKQYARRLTKRLAYARDITIAQILHLQKGRANELGTKYGLKTATVYKAAARGRRSLQLQRKTQL